MCDKNKKFYKIYGDINLRIDVFMYVYDILF